MFNATGWYPLYERLSNGRMIRGLVFGLEFAGERDVLPTYACRIQWGDGNVFRGQALVDHSQRLHSEDGPAVYVPPDD